MITVRRMFQARVREAERMFMHRKLVKVSMLLAVLALAALAASSVLAGGSRDVANLVFTEDGSPAGGVSNLQRDADAGLISARINASHLTPGDAYTYWWAVFNRPHLCLEDECGLGDLFIDPEDEAAGLNVDQIHEVGIVVLGGNGQVANNGGRAAFTGTLYEESALPHDVVIGRGGLFYDYDQMLEDAAAAEIHIVLRNHGPAKTGAALAEQLWTFWGNCEGLDPGVAPGEGFECVDEQAAVHR